MKHFYYTDRPDSHNPGARIVRCYRLDKNGVMRYVCEGNHRIGVSPGAEAIAFRALIDAGYIPKKYYTSSECPGVGPGYFAGEVRKHYSLQGIE